MADTSRPTDAEPTVGPRCGNNPNYRMTDGDRQAVDNFKARLALQAAAKPYIDRAVWADGDPLMETIAATLWKHCARDDEYMPQLVCDDPRTIAAFAAAVARAQAATAPAPADRADLRARIAAAMRTHYHCAGDAEDDFLPCSCGWLDPGPDATHDTDWDAHIADVVLAELPSAGQVDGGAGTTPVYAGRPDNGQTARADLLNTFAEWLFTTGRGSRAAADAILAKHRAEVLHDAADRYAKLADQNEAYDREQGDLDAEARLQHETVRDVAAGLRRLADEAQQQPAHSCGNCEGIDPASCLTNPDRARDETALKRAQVALAEQAGRDQAALARVHEWVTSDVVTARTSFGDGYREAQRDIRDLLDGRRLADEAQQSEPPVHGESVAHLAGLHGRRDQWASDEQAGFVPPAAEGLPAGTLEAAEIGANRLDAWARTPQGRNFLAHALIQLARTGWLRTEPGEGFEPVRERDDVPEPQDPADLAAVDARQDGEA